MGNTIELIVFDTLKAEEAFLDLSFKTNAEIIDLAVSRYHRDLEKKAEKMGECLELKCLVQLYGIGKRYDFAAGVRIWGEFVDTSSTEYRSLSRMPAAIRRVLQQQGPLYTSYGYTLVPAFYTCMEPKDIFTAEQRKNLKEVSKEAKKEIDNEKGLSASVKRMLMKAANGLAAALLEDSVMKGLAKEEREAFMKAYSCSAKKR